MQMVGNELILDENYDSGEFSVLCGMFDENDTGYTRACIDVYMDRFEDILENNEDMSIQEDIKKTIAFIDSNDIQYIEVR